MKLETVIKVLGKVVVRSKETINIEVLPINDPPSITSSAPTTAYEDSLYAYQIEVLHKIFFFVKFKQELVLTSVEIMNELALRKVCFAFNMV